MLLKISNTLELIFMPEPLMKLEVLLRQVKICWMWPKSYLHLTCFRKEKGCRWLTVTEWNLDSAHRKRWNNCLNFKVIRLLAYTVGRQIPRSGQALTNKQTASITLTMKHFLPWWTAELYHNCSLTPHPQRERALMEIW